MQHEIVPRVSVNAGYFRRCYGNLRVQDNLNIGPTDYSPYSVTAPLDSRLPNGGGYVVAGLRSEFLAATNNIITLASNYGTATEVYNGVDFTVNARLPRDRPLGRSEHHRGNEPRFTIDSLQGSGVPPSQGARAPPGCSAATPSRRSSRM